MGYGVVLQHPTLPKTGDPAIFDSKLDRNRRFPFDMHADKVDSGNWRMFYDQAIRIVRSACMPGHGATTKLERASARRRFYSVSPGAKRASETFATLPA
jgi:hypothetical protein